MQIAEEWRAIPDFWSYSVSNHGRVRNEHSGKILKPMRCGQKRKQYSVVRLSTSPRIDKKVHILVLGVFGPPWSPVKPVGRHLDDDTSNNHIANLEWGTHRDNAWDYRFKGHVNQMGRDRIIELRSRHVPGRTVAKMFKISEQRVCDIFKGRYAK